MTRKTEAINVGRGGNDAAGRPGPSQAATGTLPSSAACGQTNPCRSQTCPKTGLHADATPSPTCKPNPGRTRRRLSMPPISTDQMRRAIQPPRWFTDRGAPTAAMRLADTAVGDLHRSHRFRPDVQNRAAELSLAAPQPIAPTRVPARTVSRQEPAAKRPECKATRP